MTKISENRIRQSKEEALKALANPDDQRDPGTIEADLGLEPGQLEKWLKRDTRFRRKLSESMSPEHFLLTKSGIMKSLAAKAREGSIQHQKYFLELAREGKGTEKKNSRAEKMLVELKITPVKPTAGPSPKDKSEGSRE